MLVLAGAIVWGLWWFAPLYQGPLLKDTVAFDLTQHGELQKTTTYSHVGQRAYQRTVKTPVTEGDWLGRLRRRQNTWPWWIAGLAPLGVALLYVVRQP